MQGLSNRVDGFRWGLGIDGWFQCQMAIDGILCVPFDVHRSQFEHMSEPELGRFLERQASVLIERYGDARDPRPELAEVLADVA